MYSVCRSARGFELLVIVESQLVRKLSNVCFELAYVRCMWLELATRATLGILASTKWMMGGLAQRRGGELIEHIGLASVIRR